MKILIISDAWHPQINGVVRTYEHLIEELTKMGHTINVIGPDDFPMAIPTPGYAEIKLTFAPYRRLRKMIETQAPDKIHIATEGPLGWAARKYCIKSKRAFSTAYHTQFPDYIAKRVARFIPFSYKTTHALSIKFIRRFHAPARTILVATQSLEDTLRSWGFKNDIHRMTRGAKLDMFNLGEKTKFKDLKRPIALYVGRIAIEKNIEAFLDMEWGGSKVIVGTGPSKDKLEQTYKDAIFTGAKTGTELAKYYQSADVFVFPSRTDTFGMVIVEALVCGLPVAAYEVTGPKDILTEDFLGCMNEDLSLAAKTALKCGTAKQRNHHTSQYFTWENTAKQFENALSEPQTPPINIKIASKTKS